EAGTVERVERRVEEMRLPDPGGSEDEERRARRAVRDRARGDVRGFVRLAHDEGVEGVVGGRGGRCERRKEMARDGRHAGTRPSTAVEIGSSLPRRRRLSSRSLIPSPTVAIATPLLAREGPRRDGTRSHGDGLAEPVEPGCAPRARGARL